jgi:hypothetical protein
MSAKDAYHYAVKHALEKEGWAITHDPLYIRIDNVVDMQIDLGAESVVAAEKQGEKIAVEIKSFINPSTISEFHMAIGQFTNYRYALEEIEPNRILYLAVPSDTYNTFFRLRFIQSVIEKTQVKIVVYEPINEVIVEWKK